MIRLVGLYLLVMSTMLMAADPESGYLNPPQHVVDLLTAAPEPSLIFSPDGAWLIYVERDALPAIEDLARRRLHLAGMRIDPAANGPFRTDYARGLKLQKRGEKTQTQLPLPVDARVGQISWSHNSAAFVYTLVTNRGTELWGVTAAQPKPRLLTNRLNTVLGSFDWHPDGERLLCRLVPAERGPEPPPPAKPSGPNVQESIGNTSPQRTYQDLLANRYDEALFAHYATTQLALIDLQGKSEPIGKPELLSSIEPSPNGKYLLTTTIKRPFSYTLPYPSFPKEIAVWDFSGKLLKTIADVPVEENIPIEGVRLGPRHVGWTSSDPATLVWFEALDGGDPRTKVERRDKVMRWDAPFDKPASELLQVEHRAMSASFFADANLVAVSEYDRDRRWTRTLLHDRSQPTAAPRELDDRSLRDRYGDPGDLVKKRNQQGHVIARQDGNFVYLSGSGATPEGFLPFLDRRDLLTGKTERLWRCAPGTLEVFAILTNSAPDRLPEIITRRESPTSPPNYFVRNLAAESETKLTDFQDPTPQIRGIKKELITYQRPDGVPLSATLYLPANYQPGTRLPLFIWAYPLEFSDAGTAGQVAASPSQFTRIRGISHLTLVTQGYAVLDNATMPVVGPPETANDTFVEQIVASAQAAIDKAVELGVADRERVAVGGHSYGSFMTANLLAHCNLFRAGVARSGAFNRTLTPFGFQAERRPLWQAKESYLKLSPFLVADQIKTPLLLIHGENDENSGTFPLQSQRMFQAIKGNGGTVRLVMLPHEGHGYTARESVLHVQAETISWLNRYVRDAKPRGK